MTLDVRESKSSLAGVMMAAAMEGVGVYEFGKHVLPHLDDVPGAVGDVLSRVNLPAIDGRGALAGDRRRGGGRSPAAAPEEAAAAAGRRRRRRRPRRRGRRRRRRGGRSRAAEAGGARRAAGGGGGGEDRGGGVARGQAGRRGAGGGGEDRRGDRGPAGRRARCPTARSRRSRWRSPEAEARRAGRRARAARRRRGAPCRGRSARRPRAPGRGGRATTRAKALLENKNVVLDADAQADVRNGDGRPADGRGARASSPRSTRSSCSVIKTGHDQFTSGGSVSNHFVGRGHRHRARRRRDRQPGSSAARELADASSPSSPATCGRPRSARRGRSARPGFFTDGAHQDHLHVGFDGETAGRLRGRRPRRPPPAAAPVAGRPPRPRPPPRRPVPAGRRRGRRRSPAPRPSPGDSMAFGAVTAEDAARQARARATRWPSAGRRGPRRRAAGGRRRGGRAEAAVARRPADLSGVPDAYPGDDAPRERDRARGWPSRPRSAACRPSCRSWPRSSSPA